MPPLKSCGNPRRKKKKILLEPRRPLKTILINQPPPTLMTRNQFDALCSSFLIAPEVALECQEVREALAARNPEAVAAAIKNNF